MFVCGIQVDAVAAKQHFWGDELHGVYFHCALVDRQCTEECDGCPGDDTCDCVPNPNIKRCTHTIACKRVPVAHTSSRDK